MRGPYHLAWVAAFTTSVALATGTDPARSATLADAPETINATTKSATSELRVSRNDTVGRDAWRRTLDHQIPLCETATYINALDLLLYLALRPASGLQDPISHQTPGAVYDQVSIMIYGSTETAPLERRRALDGLYKALEFMSATGNFYAMTQETFDPEGRRLAFIRFFAPYGTSPTTQGGPLAATKRSNITGLDNGSCKSPPAIANVKGASNTSIVDTWQPATNTSDIDTLLEPPISISLPADDTSSSSNEDWFIWQDRYLPYLKMRCRFLPGPSLSWNVAYLPFAHYIWLGGFGYDRGLDNPAGSLDEYKPNAHIHFRVGGAPTGKAINPGFTNKIALMSLARIPRILFEKQAWRGIQVQVISEGDTVGVIVMISDRTSITGDMNPGPSTPMTLQNTPESSVDVA